MPQWAQSRWLTDRIGAGAVVATKPRGPVGAGGTLSQEAGLHWLHCPAPRVRPVGEDRRVLGEAGNLHRRAD